MTKEYTIKKAWINGTAIKPEHMYVQNKEYSTGTYLSLLYNAELPRHLISRDDMSIMILLEDDRWFLGVMQLVTCNHNGMIIDYTNPDVAATLTEKGTSWYDFAIIWKLNQWK